MVLKKKRKYSIKDIFESQIDGNAYLSKLSIDGKSNSCKVRVQKRKHHQRALLLFKIK
jgi:hypothetical protein